MSLARKVRQAPPSEWSSDVTRLREVRIAIVESIAAHDRPAAFKAVREYTVQTLAIAGEPSTNNGSGWTTCSGSDEGRAKLSCAGLPERLPHRAAACSAQAVRADMDGGLRRAPCR